MHEAVVDANILRTVISFDRRMQRIPGTVVIDDPDQVQAD